MRWVYLRWRCNQLLRDMFPNLTTIHVVDGRGRDTESSRQYRLRHHATLPVRTNGAEQLDDLFDLFCREFGHAITLPTHGGMAPHTDTVLGVLCWCNPFQIRDAVIRSIAVDMIDDVARRTRANESFGHEAVHSSESCFMIQTAEANSVIHFRVSPSVKWLKFHDMAGKDMTAFRAVPRTANAT